MLARAHARGELTPEDVAKIGANFAFEVTPSPEQDSVSTCDNPGSTVRIAVGSTGTTFTLSGRLSQDDADLARGMFETALRRRVG